MNNRIYYDWDVTDRIKLCYNLWLVANHRTTYQKIVFNTITDKIVKDYFRKFK